MTNNKSNHKELHSTESNGSRINCQMNNLLEEDEDELEGETIDNADGSKGEALANGAHLSGDKQNQNGKDVVAIEPPQSLIINRANGLKTETCI